MNTANVVRNIIVALVAVETFVFNASQPLLPSFLPQLVASNAASWYGRLSTINLLGRFFGSYLMGRITDCIGAKRAMIISLAGEALLFFACYFVPNVFLLAVIFFLKGLSSTKIPTAMIIQVAVPQAQRPQTFGWIRAADFLGVMGGYLTAGFVGEPIGWRYMQLFTGGINCLSLFVFVLATWNVDLNTNNARTSKKTVGTVAQKPSGNASLHTLISVGLVSFANQSTAQLIGTHVVLLRLVYYGWSVRTLSFSLIVAIVCHMIVNAQVCPRVVKFFGVTLALRVCAPTAAIIFGLHAAFAWNELWAHLVIDIVQWVPVFVSMISNATRFTAAEPSGAQRAKVTIFADLASVWGPTLVGELCNNGLWWVPLFYIAALQLLIACPVIYIYDGPCCLLKTGTLSTAPSEAVRQAV